MESRHEMYVCVGISKPGVFLSLYLHFPSRYFPFLAFQFSFVNERGVVIRFFPAWHVSGVLMRLDLWCVRLLLEIFLA